MPRQRQDILTDWRHAEQFLGLPHGAVHEAFWGIYPRIFGVLRVDLLSFLAGDHTAEYQYIPPGTGFN